MKCTKCGNDISENEKFCINCGKSTVPVTTSQVSQVADNLSKIKKINFKNDYKTPKARIIWGVIIGGLILWGIISDNSSNQNSATGNSSPQTTQAVQNTDTSNIPNQDKIASSVVNILCTDGTNNDSGSSGGSGTIMDTDGLILTNAHIIPNSSTGDVSNDGCIVTLPDEQGKIKEIYYGSPVIIPKLSQEYDLAFVKINASYTDDKGVTWGNYPNTFPSFLDTVCENDNPTLGESVRVFGYPAISGGGYYLTVTDGVVSSLPNDGTIVTSAKISHGNSGGIAVDESGCFIGIPAMFDSDNAGSLGILISNNTILEFMQKLKVLQDSQ